MFFVTAGLAVLTTLFFGILPAWRAGRADPGTLLKSRTAAQRRSPAAASSPSRWRCRSCSSCSATLLSQSLLRLPGEPTGFALDHVTIQTPPFHLLPREGEAKLDLYQRMVDRIERAPGMTLRGRHVVHADDRLPGHRAGSRPSPRARRARGRRRSPTTRRPRLLPDDGDGDSVGPRVRAARARARRLRAEPGGGRAPVPGQPAIGRYVRAARSRPGRPRRHPAAGLVPPPAASSASPRTRSSPACASRRRGRSTSR